MKTYQQVAVADSDLRRVQKLIVDAANRPDPFAEYEYLHAEPAKVRAGMEVLADGTDWNPGSGEGKYRRNAANSAWVFLG